MPCLKLPPARGAGNRRPRRRIAGWKTLVRGFVDRIVVNIVSAVAIRPSGVHAKALIQSAIPGQPALDKRRTAQTETQAPEGRPQQGPSDQQRTERGRADSLGGADICS